MQSILVFILILLILALVGFIAALLRSRPQGPATGDLHELAARQGQQLQQATTLLLQQLNQQQESQERNSHIMHTRIDTATKVVSDVQGKLIQLEEANKRIFDLGKDISDLQRVLQAPKLRGGLGETWLAEIISQIMPSGNYKLQYRFRTGEICDAAIFLRDGLILPIDAKFSLENFQKMMEADESQRGAYKKVFVQDTKKRIDEIARKYVLPTEGTLDLAFMYVPAENVYYQAFIQEDDMSLLNYAFSKRVIPVSPSSFYAYLQVILLGLRGMEIERSAKEIQRNLAGLAGDVERFREAHEKVGVHLRHAQASYDQTDKRLDKVETSFSRLSQSEASSLIDPPAALTVPSND